MQAKSIQAGERTQGSIGNTRVWMDGERMFFQLAATDYTILSGANTGVQSVEANGLNDGIVTAGLGDGICDLNRE